MAKRILVFEFVQETNSFNPVPSGFEAFNVAGAPEGDALLHANGKAGVGIEGILTALRERDFTPVGGTRIRARSGGAVDHRVVDWLYEKLDPLLYAGSLDGVAASLHGATVSDTSEDVCGDLLAHIRGILGQDAVIGVSCDLHANVTERMAQNADFICGFQTYPHLDHFEASYRAAALVMDKLSGRPLTTARVAIPMMAPPHGYTTGSGRLRELMERGHALVREGKIADFSVFQVQPWMDLREIASTVLVTAESAEVAKEVALSLAREEFALRKELQGEPLWTIPQVVQAALENSEDAPVVLVDSADSPNAGACGDSAAVLEAVLPYRDTLRCALAVDDIAAVEKAFALGVGGRADFTLGASLAPKLSRPVTVRDAVVRSLHSGEFRMEGPQERGQLRSIGRSAVLQAGELLILVGQHSAYCGDLQFYRSFGIEPTLCRLVDVKACTSFRAGYAPLAARICNTATPGAAGTVLTDLPFTRLPKPLYPFEEITEEMISEPVCYR